MCKLTKHIYGLKQPSKQWFSKLTTTLNSKKYIQSSSYHSLFNKHFTCSFTALLVYVDDLVLTGNDITEINSIKSFLDQTFKLKDLGHLKYFSGLKISRSHVGIC